MITADTKVKKTNLPETKAISNGHTPITPDIEAKSPLAIITLAIALPKGEVKRLGRWFHQNVDPQALLEVHQDKEMVGGCRIIWRGAEGDFSLRRKFQK